MPKKKRTKRLSRRPKRSVPNQAARLGTTFRTSRLERGLDPDDAWIIDTLIELKRDYLDIADPTVWPAEETEELLTALLPRKVSMDPEDRERVAPVLTDFFTFLHQAGRWSPKSMPFDDVPDLIEDLGSTLPEVLSDPSRRGMAGNLFDFARSQGVDLSDQDQLDAFMQRYNTLDEADRRAVTDTGQLAPGSTAHQFSGAPVDPPGAAFGLGGPAGIGDNVLDGGLGDDILDDELDDLHDLWPDYLGAPPDPIRGVAAMDSADPRELAGTVLTHRAEALLELLGDRLALTGTKGLRRADLTRLLQSIGIDARPRSVWDVPEVALPWVILQASGFVEIHSGSAYPGTAVLPWVGADGDPHERLPALRMLHATALRVVLGLPDEEDTMTTSPLIQPALLKAAEPGGLTVTVPADPDGATVAIKLLTDLSTMVRAGLVEQAEQTQQTEQAEAERTFHVHPSLLELMPAALLAAQDPDALGRE